MPNAPIIGIDLGTTNSLAAYMQGGRPAVIRDDAGHGIVPSVVSFATDAPPLVGRPALARRLEAPADTVYSVKRLMGKGLDEVRAESGALAYTVVAAERELVKVQVAGGAYTPQEVSATILREIKQRASAYFGAEVTEAVITVPAYFDDSQRQATRDAGRIAGLQVRRIVNEPTAAALAYGLDQKREGLIAVYDLGGGTFDLSLLRLHAGVFQVIATCGDTHLGGDDFDRLLVELAAEAIQQQHGLDILSDPLLLQTAKHAAEQCKIQLSDAAGAKFEFALPDGVTFSRDITRDAFEHLIAPLLTQTLQACRQALADADLVAKQIDNVVMVGGSTRIPLVQKTVSEFFQSPAHTECNPDEVVALGAAVQAGILAGDSRDALLLDVLPLSLGIETMGGAMAKLIMRNAPIPARATEDFSTYADNQTGVEINIYQGERELVHECRALGTFTLRGIPPMPAGRPRVEVTFLVDADGILTVSALEKQSGTVARIEVVPSHGLTEDEVRAMVDASVTHAREDMLAHRLIDLRNEVQSVARATRKTLAELGDRVEADTRTRITTELDELIRLAESNDADAIYGRLNALNELTQPLAQQVMDGLLDVTVKGRALSDVTAPDAKL